MLGKYMGFWPTEKFRKNFWGWPKAEGVWGGEPEANEADASQKLEKGEWLSASWEVKKKIL